MTKSFTKLIAVMAFVFPATAIANDSDFELWLNPSISTSLDEDTSVEFETAQRFRDADKGREDTYFTRLWLTQDIMDNATLGGAVERRINDGGSDETRTMQQLSTSHGIFRTRLRLEQRFVDDADRMGLRLRPRLGVKIPLDKAGRWSFKTDAELFFTIRGNNTTSDEGLTGLRTQVGFGYDVNDNLSISAAYLRGQGFNDGGPDEVGHAPIIGIEYSF